MLHLMTTDEWRNGRHVVYRLHAHIILVAKYRKKVMTKRVTADLRDSFEEVCSRFDVTLDAFETDTDHAHLIITYPPKVALSRLVMSLKTISSMRVRSHGWPEITKALWGDHFWSPSYAVVSCGGAPLDIIKKYVENQQAPNRIAGRPPLSRPPVVADAP
jgi:putative transposase